MHKDDLACLRFLRRRDPHKHIYNTKNTNGRKEKMSNIRETYERLLKFEQGLHGDTFTAKKSAWMDTCNVYVESGATTPKQLLEISNIGKEIAEEAGKETK